MTRVAVLGGGITGLVAARDAAVAGAEVTLVEPGPLGGKVQTTPFDGHTLDESADAFLARVPEGVELCRELGLEGDLVSPVERRAHVWSGGELRRLPEEQVLGVPTDLDALAASGIVSPEGLAAARRDLDVPLTPPEGDVAIGSVLRSRLGDEVVDRLVDPLVGGINAGDTDRLSLAATVPQIDAAVRSGAASLIEACAAQRAAADRAAPVFFAPRTGMGAIPARLVAELDRLGVDLRSAAATALSGHGRGWDVVLADGGRVQADGVLIAAPAFVAADLVRPVHTRAATLLAAIPYASVTMVSIAVARAGIDRELDGSGYLIPRTEGLLTTACSWTSAKWPHLHGDGDTVWLRASVGRDGAPPTGDVVATVLADLATTMALRGEPLDVRVSSWPRSLPQYRPGHLDHVATIDATLPDGIVVAGAAYRGLGIPACIRQGQSAVQRLLR